MGEGRHVSTCFMQRRTASRRRKARCAGAHHAIGALAELVPPAIALPFAVIATAVREPRLRGCRVERRTRSARLSVGDDRARWHYALRKAFSEMPRDAVLGI